MLRSVARLESVRIGFEPSVKGLGSDSNLAKTGVLTVATLPSEPFYLPGQALSAMLELIGLLFSDLEKVRV